MVTLKLLYFISLFFTFLLISISLIIERKSFKSIAIERKGLTRVVIATIITIILGAINIFENQSITKIINARTYKYVFVLLVLFLIIWTFKSIKNKNINLFKRAFEKKLNFEELFLYIILINLLFPLGSDILNRKTKFPIQLSLSAYSDYPSYLIDRSYTNIHDVLNIQNNENNNYNVLIETFASQVQTKKYLDSISEEETKDYNFYKQNAIIYYKNEGIVNSNSQIKLDMFSGKAFIPNFIGHALDCDSMAKIISGDTLFYFNRLLERAKQELTKGIDNSNCEEYNSFIIKTPEMSWWHTFSMEWVSKITIYNINLNSTYTFTINRVFIHKATLLMNEVTDKIYLAPGLINNNCHLNIKYIFNQKEKTFTKDAFLCQFVYDFKNGQTIYKDLGTRIIDAGKVNENILSNKESFPIYYYVSPLYIIDEKYYEYLIDNL